MALLDHRPVSARDLNAQFYLRPEDVGKNVGSVLPLVFCILCCVFMDGWIAWGGYGMWNGRLIG